MASDSDEDYMSDVLLSNIGEVRPGIHSTNRAQRRLLQIDANRRAAEERAVEATRRPVKKAELERNLLEEGLSRPIDSASKGFSLLSKMGYKPGMSLGRKRDGDTEGIKEPLAIALKAAKTGLGHEAEEVERQRERCEQHLAHMRQRVANENVIVEDFRVRKRFASVQKRLIADLQKARKACQELDLRKDVETPHEYWFWPIHRRMADVPTTSVSETTSIVVRASTSRKGGNTNNEENVEYEYVYANGRSAAAEELNLYEWDENELEEKLSVINVHIRSTHYYCIWCGYGYKSPTDLAANCLGASRECHDGDDHDDEE